MIITVTRVPEAQARLQQGATRNGQAVEEFLRGLVEQQVSYLLSLPPEPPAWVAG